MSQFIDACAAGFSPDGDPEANSLILSKLLEENLFVRVSAPGIYPIGGAVVIGSGRTLDFAPGAVLKRTVPPSGATYAIINRAAYAEDGSAPDENITVTGLHLICGGVERCPIGKNPMAITGLRGQLSFFRVRGLVIRGFETLDLPAQDFGIHICTFENVLIEDVHIEGRKDAVHFGRGTGFTVRHGLFRTFDDPIALNAHDYASSNPQLGPIENGLIEDCTDLDDTDTTGFFCRILAGSWCRWQSGMTIRNSDTVVTERGLYRAVMAADGKEFVSLTEPTHTCGTKTMDGINWAFVQKDVCFDCGCRNIIFRNIRIEKNRPTAFSIHFDDDAYSHSVYPGSVPPVQENIIISGVRVTGNVPVFLSTKTPLRNCLIEDCELNGGKLRFSSIPSVLQYPEAGITLTNTASGGVIEDERVPYSIREL